MATFTGEVELVAVIKQRLLYAEQVLDSPTIFQGLSIKENVGEAIKNTERALELLRELDSVL